jgi:hypothetical protein
MYWHNIGYPDLAKFIIRMLDLAHENVKDLALWPLALAYSGPEDIL